MMRNFLFLLSFSLFSLTQVHNAHAGKPSSRALDDAEQSVPTQGINNLSISRTNKNIKEQGWEPSTPLKPSMRVIWEEKARNNPGKYRIINGTLWIKKTNS